MTQHQIICAIAEMWNLSMNEAYNRYEEEKSKGYESFMGFLESIGDWYFNL